MKNMHMESLRSGGMVIIFLLFCIILHTSRCDVVKVSVTGDGSKELGKSATLTCQSNDTSVTSLQWLFQDRPLSNVTSKSKTHAVYAIKNVTFDHFGSYVCSANISEGEVLNVHNVTFEFLFKVSHHVTIKPVHEVVAGENVSMVCTVTGYPRPTNIHWRFLRQPVANSDSYHVMEVRKNPGEISSTVTVVNASPAFNGTYTCHTPDGDVNTQLVVKSKPNVAFQLVKAVGKTKIFCNWTLNNGNSKIQKLELQYYQFNVRDAFKVPLDPRSNSFLITKLKPGEEYFNFSILAQNVVDKDINLWENAVITLSEDPHFVPQISVNGFTSNTVTLGWNILPSVAEYFTYYNVTVQSKSGKQQFYTANENPPFMVEKLTPGADYIFKVQACSSYVRSCDEFSPEVNGTTMDGMSSPPRNLTIKCHYDNSSHETLVSVSWDEPSDPQGLVMEYEVVLSGNASYFNKEGRFVEDRIVPITKNVRQFMARKVDFPGQPPNTQIFVNVCAITRSKRCGATVEATCSTPEAIPDTQELSQASWKQVQRPKSKQIIFMVKLPHISQRNGTICCFRFIVVRMPKDQSAYVLKPPSQMEISSYEAVHNGSNFGAYVAAMIDANSNSRNIIIGDGIDINEHQLCRKCWSQQDEFITGGYRPSGHYPLYNSIETTRHRKRHTNSNVQQHSGVPLINPYDGPLDASSTYTAYLDAIVINEKHERMRAQSKYLPPITPISLDAHESVIPGVAIISSLIVALVVVLIALMCVMRWKSKEPGEQEYGLSHSIQQWCRRLRGQQPIPSEEPPNLPPLSKDELVSAYLERHKDSDLGFQQEFEKLPDRFCDRTANASDNQNNIGKNRYPDIKAYDQTRVKLSTMENGSDYINANFVVGYKERKKFVCAQGPMEATVVDWWRLIWEQHVHFILMLTNVEEYNKTKCAKYWPSEGSTNYADFMVTHCSEKRYSDFLVRTLKLSKTRTGSGNNIEEGNKEEREILQYHYLVWKDFMAPEHPVGILRFIKRFNEAYAPDKGPILVHCSAGVGRTGTLVALDSMLQQLNEEGSVTIFNTICDLRHQRNYLVQSLKQYIFIYRALMEMAQFGDTDVCTPELKSQIEKLKGTADGKSVTRFQEQFEMLVQVIEDRKPFTVGASEENNHRNRHENVIPYDRNRVHLSPMPGINKEINTYINASFIEGYDNTEQFIIAQDPLDVTIGDFWRLIVEQNIRSIVMLSETGDEKCPRYWPEKDQETSHDYIKVKYMQSQSFPFYYRREFTVTDTKTDHSTLVTQFQYNGWPHGEGEVPQIDRGIVELIDTTFKYKETLEGNVGPIVVHCSDGADRSCIFVALAILVQQMMNESRVDVFSVVRKLRSQRQGLFRNFAQYEFIYRGLHTYAELHVSNGNAGH